ncbi:hypothetical protein GS882_03750 [Rhodococcus hoagii]|uniref:Uncharacterized protein n=1 Tax=Rhodococcus hoagii TaxID=43767 RepID=A0A9Q4ZIL9_RHOHA|nr:hypothetical protein [Prescottella equi]NKT77329.1 hypothetical protein [Prescottella equi]
MSFSSSSAAPAISRDGLTSSPRQSDTGLSPDLQAFTTFLADEVRGDTDDLIYTHEYVRQIVAGAYKYGHTTGSSGGDLLRPEEPHLSLVKGT